VPRRNPGWDKPFAWDVYQTHTSLSFMVLQGLQQWFTADHIAKAKARGTGSPGEGIGKEHSCKVNLPFV